jgi:hypothetical protein
LLATGGIFNAKTVILINSYEEKYFVPLYFFLHCDFQKCNFIVKQGLTVIANIARDYVYLQGQAVQNEWTSRTV